VLPCDPDAVAVQRLPSPRRRLRREAPLALAEEPAEGLDRLLGELLGGRLGVLDALADQPRGMVGRTASLVEAAFRHRQLHLGGPLAAAGEPDPDLLGGALDPVEGVVRDRILGRGDHGASASEEHEGGRGGGQRREPAAPAASGRGCPRRRSPGRLVGADAQEVPVADVRGDRLVPEGTDPAFGLLDGVTAVAHAGLLTGVS
jgi:hypothetical protein